MISFVRRSIPARSLQKVVLALDVVVWLFWLPLMVRIHTIPRLLERLARIGGRQKRKTPMDLKDAVKIVTRICNLRPFRLRVFPQRCLRQSLTLYRTLTRLGYPVEIHMGVFKNAGSLIAHSWVIYEGKPIADEVRTDSFKVIYSYPAKTVSDPMKNGGNHEKEKSCAG